MQLSLRDEKTKTFKITEKPFDNQDQQISTKKQQSRLYFESLNLDFSSYQFDREQANER